MNYQKIANALIKAYELDVEPDELAAYIKKIDVGAAKAKRPAAEVEAEPEEGAIEYSEPDENGVVMFKTPQTCVRIVTPKGGASAPCGAKAIRGLVGDDGEVQGCCGTVASGHLAAMIRDSKKESAKAGPTAKAAKTAPSSSGGGGVKKLVAKNLGVYVEERERVTEVPGTKYFKDSTGLLFVKTHDSYEVVGVLSKQGGKVVPGKITIEARKSIQRRNLPVAASATYVTLDGEDDGEAEEEEVEEPKPKANASKAKAPKAKAAKASPPEDEEEVDGEEDEEEPKPKAKAPKAKAPKAKAVKASPPEDDEVDGEEEVEEPKAKAPKAKTPKAKAAKAPPPEDEVDEEEEVDEPKPKAKAPKAKAPKAKAPPPEDEVDGEEDEEEPKPKAKAPKAKAVKAPKAKVPPPEDEVDDDEEEEVPPPKAKAPKAKAPKAKTKAPPADEDEDEEVEEPKPKAKAKAVPKKAFIDVVEEDEGEAYDGEEDDEEDDE